MTNFDLEQLENAREAANLDPIRKGEIRGNLHSFMENHPVRVGVFSRLTQYRTFSFLKNNKFAPVFLTLVLMVVFLAAGAGTTFAANQSLPGDVLYPIKINITERIKLAFAASSEARAEARLSLLDHRIEEGTTLASRGTLSAETVTKLEALIAKYQADLADIYENLSDEEKLSLGASISARLEAMINVHARALAKFSDDEDNNNFRANLRMQLSDTAKTHQKLVDSEDASQNDEQGGRFENASENKINAAEQVLAEAKRYVEKVSTKGVTIQVSESADAQLDEAEAKLEAARTEQKDGKFRQAFLSANETIRLAQQAKAVIRIGHNLKVDLNVTGDSLDANDNDNDDSHSDPTNRDGEVRGDSDEQSSPKSEDSHGLNFRFGR